MTEAAIVLAAYGLDRAFGEPPNAVHPVAWIGRAIVITRQIGYIAGVGVLRAQSAASNRQVSNIFGS